MNFVNSCLIFTVKIMIFIKNTIFIFFTVTSNDKKGIYYVHFSVYLLQGYIEIPKKMTPSFREGGRGQPKDDTGLCGGMEGSKTPQKRMT